MNCIQKFIDSFHPGGTFSIREKHFHFERFSYQKKAQTSQEQAKKHWSINNLFFFKFQKLFSREVLLTQNCFENNRKSML